MAHAAISQIQRQVEAAKSDSDFTYFNSLLLLGEAMLKTTVLGFLGVLVDEPDRHRYRLEHKILRADGLGPWGLVLEDALTGPASQFLLSDFSREKNELANLFGPGTWQFDCVTSLKCCLGDLQIPAEDVPTLTDMKRWFGMFTALRNKTRGHGATKPGKVSIAATHLAESIELLYSNHSLFKRDWAYLYRNLSGKYRVTPITDTASSFDPLKKVTDKAYPNGVYLYVTSPRLVPFLESDADLADFFYPNGSFAKRSYECLSYATDTKKEGNGSDYLILPGRLPSSETQGLGELQQLGSCFSNAPTLSTDYIARPALEESVKHLLLDDYHPVITLLGRGGIGKTMLALKAIDDVSKAKRFEVIIWFSARDVDLQFSGPKPVRPHVVNAEDVSRLYVNLVAPERIKETGFRCKEFFETQLNKNELGSCLYVFDNFETTKNPIELFSWIETHIRNPNKILITTRLRDFKGDYPVEVGGMEKDEAEKLIGTTAQMLHISHLLTTKYVDELIQQAEGHPYVIKILLGEVVKEKRASSIPRLVANRDEILTALFERTYASLSPFAQRIFMTLAAWNSTVPRVALEAVLHQAIDEHIDIEGAIDELIQYSLAEQQRSMDGQYFVGLPLVATVFGRKKLNVSSLQATIKTDVKILQMLGPVNRGEVHFSAAKRIEFFLGNIARRVEKGDSFDRYTPIIEMICRNYPPAWLSLARLHMELDSLDGYELAKSELKRYLEQDSTSSTAAEAWKNLAHCCYKTGDMLGDIHAFIQRSKIASVPFVDLTNTSKLLNDLIRRQALNVGQDEKKYLGKELLQVLQSRMAEANADDFGQMAWLSLRLNEHDLASDFVRRGLKLDPDNEYLMNLANEPNITI